MVGLFNVKASECEVVSCHLHGSSIQPHRNRNPEPVYNSNRALHEAAHIAQVLRTAHHHVNEKLGTGETLFIMQEGSWL